MILGYRSDTTKWLESNGEFSFNMRCNSLNSAPGILKLNISKAHFEAGHYDLAASNQLMSSRLVYKYNYSRDFRPKMYSSAND